MRLLPYGPAATLVEFDTLDDVVAAADAWRAAAITGVVELVPAARTILIRHDETFDVGALRQPIGGVAAHDDRPVVSLDVTYDGADLAAVAAASSMSVDDVIALHSGATYTVAFCGFMPGFAYMVGLPAALVLPRRATPRTRVPAGSVAIAGEFAGVYPRESPGGWHLLGRTVTVLWDDDRDPPALLPPGTTVRFRQR